MVANTFTGTVHQTKELAELATTVSAIVTLKSVVAQGAVASAQSGKLVIGFVADGSGSMSGEKWRAAKQALLDSVAKLPENCEFFVIIGRSHADTVVPAQQATAANKAAAIARIRNLSDEGGTKFSKWLAEARAQFGKTQGNIRVLVFLTDGENDENGDALLIQELARCKGLFEVESRGVGDAYKPEQLRLIQASLSGSVDIIRQPQDLADDFAAILDRAGSLSMSDVFLQVWTPQGARVKMVKQFGNEILDLTSQLKPGSKPQTVRVPTGNWGEEVRDFHLVVELDAAGKVGDPVRLCARVTLVYDENGQEKEIKLDAGGQVVAIWTDDEKKSAVINPKVANYTGQAELAEKIQEGIRELEAGNEEAATRALQRANELAEQTGHEGTQKLIRKIADVDPDKGTLRIKKDRSTMDVRELDTRSQRTARTQRVS